MLVIDQGTVLDRIDFNMEQVVGEWMGACVRASRGMGPVGREGSCARDSLLTRSRPFQQYRAHQGGRAPTRAGGGEPEVGQGHQVHHLAARPYLHFYRDNHLAAQLALAVRVCVCVSTEPKPKCPKSRIVSHIVCATATHLINNPFLKEAHKDLERRVVACSYFFLSFGFCRILFCVRSPLFVYSTYVRLYCLSLVNGVKNGLGPPHHRPNPWTPC